MYEGPEDLPASCLGTGIAQNAVLTSASVARTNII